MYKCGKCNLRGCSNGNMDKLMKICPTREIELQQKAKQLYEEEENRKIAYNAGLVEAEGYCQYTRLKEIIEFAKKCGYKKIGIAFCIGLKREMQTVQKIFEHHGFEVFSVICKNGVMPKSTIGLEASQTISKCSDEVMCNPIGQALFLNEAKVDLNVILGLCVGHDTLAMKYMEAPITTLVVKDRVTGHNPVAAIYNAESYFEKKLFDKDEE